MNVDEFLLKNPLFDVSDLDFLRNSGVFGPEMLENWDKNLRFDPDQEGAILSHAV